MTTLLLTFLIAAIQGGPPPSSAEEAVALARKALSDTLQVPGDQFEVESTAATEWRDSSLGCPERGMVYAPALVPGFKVTLRAAGRRHVVHVGGGRAVVCSSATDTKVSPVPLLTEVLERGAAVRKALATRLQVPESEVRIIATRPARRDQRPCTSAPTTADGVPYIVEARAAGKAYRYYADRGTTVDCTAPKRR